MKIALIGTHLPPPERESIVELRQLAAGLVIWILLAFVSAMADLPEDATELGNQLLEQGNVSAAVQAFTIAIDLDNSHIAAIYGRGLSHAQQNNFDAAVADLGKAIRLNPKMAEAYSARGLALLYQGKVAIALADLDEAIRQNPNDAAAYANRSGAHLKNQDYESAIADATVAIRLDANGSAAYNHRSAARFGKRDYEGAISDASEAIRLSPETHQGYANRAQAALAKGELEQVIEDASRVILIDQNLRDAYKFRAKAYYRLGRLREALDDVNQAVRLSPSDIGTRLVLVQFKLESGDLDGAIAACKDTVANDPKCFQAYYYCGYAYFKKGDYNQAIVQYSEAIRLNPDPDDKSNDPAYRGRAMAHEMQAKADLARLREPGVVPERGGRGKGQAQ